jgi:hypothetical protein
MNLAPAVEAVEQGNLFIRQVRAPERSGTLAAEEEVPRTQLRMFALDARFRVPPNSAGKPVAILTPIGMLNDLAGRQECDSGFPA